MTFKLIGKRSLHQIILYFPMSLTGLVCINAELEQFLFPLQRVGTSSMAHIDVVNFLKPGEYLELQQLGFAV